MSKRKDNKQTLNVLIVDDQLMWRLTTENACREILTSLHASSDTGAGVEIKFHLAGSVADAMDIMNGESIQLCLLDKDLGVDQKGGKISGVDRIRDLKSVQPFCQVVMLTADNSLRDMAQAFRNGASDYLFKSDDNGHREYRIEVLRKALQLNLDEVSKAKSKLAPKCDIYSNYVCKSAAMQRFDNKLLAVSESTRPFLILGETGLGRGAVARRVSELPKKVPRNR